jgi:hypothetical protein
MERLVRRSAELKAELLAYCHGRRFDRALYEALTDRFGSPVVAKDENELINFYDRFLLQRRLSDGRTVVERFVRARGDLPRAERDMLLGWRDVVEGIFEVDRLDGEVLVAVNLIDDLVYRIRTNAGPALFEQTPPGSFLAARVVPILGDWLLSGAQETFLAECAEQLCDAAAKTALKHPDLVFRNPELLERAWRQQRDDRAQFIEFFGSDQVVLPGDHWAERVNEYWRHRSGAAAAPLRMDASRVPPAQTMGVIYDEVEGMSFFAEFGTFQQVFEDPALITQAPYREVVRTYLQDDSVSPLPFRRLVHAHPDHADQVFAHLLGRPSFTWSRDGEKLLRRTKAAYYDSPPMPRVITVGPRLTASFKRLRAADSPLQSAGSSMAAGQR